MTQDIENRSSSSDRAYYRVRVDIPLRMTPVEENEVEGRASEVLSQIDPPMPEMDPAIIGWLDRIERKLDRLLAHEHLLDGLGAGLENRHNVDLSAAGLHFSSEEPVAHGSAMLLEFEIPEVPIRLIRCIGRVTGTGQPDLDPDRHPIGVAFETIRQADRDAVVRYTLAVQRQTIRSGAKRRGSAA